MPCGRGRGHTRATHRPCGRGSPRSPPTTLADGIYHRRLTHGHILHRVYKCEHHFAVVNQESARNCLFSFSRLPDWGGGCQGGYDAVLAVLAALVRPLTPLDFTPTLEDAAPRSDPSSLRIGLKESTSADTGRSPCSAQPHFAALRLHFVLYEGLANPTSHVTMKVETSRADRGRQHDAPPDSFRRRGHRGSAGR